MHDKTNETHECSIALNDDRPLRDPSWLLLLNLSSYLLLLPWDHCSSMIHSKITMLLLLLLLLSINIFLLIWHRPLLSCPNCNLFIIEEGASPDRIQTKLDLQAGDIPEDRLIPL